jgi:lysozyme family protein
MQVDYEAFIARVIKRYEGGYGWNRSDPGGPTNYGVTCYDLAEHRHLRMTSMAAWADQVKNMGLPEAEAIYQDKYAAGVSFSILPTGADCCILDYAINSGVSRAVLVTHSILRSNKNTRIDSTTTALIEAYGVEKFITVINQERLAFMHAIRGGAMWREFGHGWGARVADLQSYCSALVSHTAPESLPVVDLANVVTPKATHVAKTAGPLTAGGVVTVPAGAHFAGASHALVAGAALGILAVGVAYEAWQASKTATANALVHLPVGA